MSNEKIFKVTDKSHIEIMQNLAELNFYKVSFCDAMRQMIAKKEELKSAYERAITEFDVNIQKGMQAIEEKEKVFRDMYDAIKKATLSDDVRHEEFDYDDTVKGFVHIEDRKKKLEELQKTMAK